MYYILGAIICFIAGGTIAAHYDYPDATLIECIQIFISRIGGI